ncbi:hypothetical protein RF55_25493 [Lasius niger]|uniref:Uncharacterized protein n=1 Tax=Lasius niger TaxID=67767 RepID=A0A0J7JUG9_LASNI|nr:hypothetical protein RF55_25493 [Lasius niger]
MDTRAKLEHTWIHAKGRSQERHVENKNWKEGHEVRRKVGKRRRKRNCESLLEGNKERHKKRKIEMGNRKKGVL